MQTKNQNEKYETNLPPCLGKALSFKVNKRGEGNGEAKENNLTM